MRNNQNQQNSEQDESKSSTTTTPSKTIGFSGIDIMILLICFAVLVITITLCSIYGKRRKLLSQKNKKNKSSKDDQQENQKNPELEKANNKEAKDAEQPVDKDKTDITNNATHSVDIDSESKRNSEKNKKSYQLIHNTHHSLGSIGNITDITAANLSSNAMLKPDINSNKSKGKESNKSKETGSTARGLGSVRLSVAKSDREMLKSEKASSSQSKEKRDRDAALNNIDEYDLTSSKIDSNFKKRVPKEIPNGKLDKKTTKESSHVLKDFESFKISSVKNDSSRDNIFSLSSQSKKKANFAMKNIFHKDNEEIQSESEDEEVVNVHDKNKEEFKRHGQVLLNTFKKYEDNILDDSLADKEKYLYNDDDINILRKGTGKQSHTSDEDIKFKSRLEMARLEQKKKNIDSSKFPQKKNSIEFSKIDNASGSFKSKNQSASNIFTDKKGQKQENPFNYIEDKMTPNQHSEFWDDD